jgi:putative spermidine/putrescine transport system ATP-binding protein
MQTQESPALVSFRNVQKSYDGETLIVKDLNLDVYRGEFLTLLGPSGSGKTTCLMLLAGFETPTAGQILMDGQLLNTIPPHQRNIGMVFQNYALFPHLTVRENLKFPLTVRKLPAAEIDERVKKALAMVQLEKLGGRYPQQLSGGQQQRIALARALVFDPNLVLMDEPLGALDKQLREHMQIEIKHIHESLGITVVFVTHDQSEALTMSDRVAVFNHGVIQQIDPAIKLYEEPANAFVAGFIGESNSLAGTIERLDGGACAVRLESGATVQARAGNIGSNGATTVLSIRPERVILGGEASRCENRFIATLQEMIYLGDQIRARLDVVGNPNFMAKTSIAHWDRRLKVGDKIDVGFPPENLRALAPM